MNIRRILALLLIIIMSIFVLNCSQEIHTNKSGVDEIAKSAKYVFLFIGDGMAMPQISATEIYLQAIESETINPKELTMSSFPVIGFTTTHDAGTYITDSASAATAISTGNKTLSGVINMDTKKEKKYTTIAEMAKKKGIKVGIVSSVSLDHATPAAFYAHQPSRNNYYEISVELTNSNFDYFGGGSFLSLTGKDKDKQSVIEIAKSKGYTIINSKADFEKLKNGAEKVIAMNEIVDNSSALKYSVDRENSGSLSLVDYTRKGIELLDNENGFFFMIEGGKIDWACHANDAVAAIKDVIEFDNAIAEAVKFYNQHPNETLIIVTGDHETGGMSIGFAGTKYSTYFKVMEKQNVSYEGFDIVLAEIKKTHTATNTKLSDIMPLITKHFGLGSDELPLTNYEKTLLENALSQSLLDKKDQSKDDYTYLMYGGYEPLTVQLTHILNQKAGIGWTSYSHTGVPVATFAIGVSGEMFGGFYDNTDIFKKLLKIMDIK